MKNHLLIMLITAGMFAGISSCKEDEPEKPTNEEELITTLNLRFFNAADSTPAGVFVFKDADGEGGLNPQVWDTIRLQKGISYFAEIELLNESNPADVEDITAEVKEEATEHLFCYLKNLNGLDIQIKDTDGNLPLGLKTSWMASSSGNGQVTISLKHQPDGLKNGDCAPGDTDIEVVFQLEVKD